MPRGRKPKALKDKNSKGKKMDAISTEVRDIFFNVDVPNDSPENLDEVIGPVTDEVVEEIAELEDPTELAEDTEIPKEIEAPETVSISEGVMGDSESFMVISSYSDDGDELQTIQTIRGNKPPEPSWADTQAKFFTGQRIMPKKLTEEEAKNYEAASVISPGLAFDTYFVKMSRSMNEISVKGSDWVLASSNCKPYVSYWDSISPVIKMRKL